MASAAPTSRNNPAYRPDIDGLRAIAVAAVMGFHAFPLAVRGGFAGVDVFFVISGYLISGLIMQGLDRGSFRFRDFYARRVRRIFPALGAVLLACYAYGWFYLLPIDYRQLGKHVASAAGFVANFTLWSEAGYFDRAAEAKPLLHLWSLGVEEQFYIAWPLLLWCLWKSRLNVLACCAAIALFSLAFSIRGAVTDPVAAFYSPLSRFWELLLGSCLAYTSVRPWHSSEPGPRHDGLRNVQSWIGLGCIAAAFVLLSKDRAFPGWWALLPTIGTFLVISAGSTAWPNRRVLAHPILVWVGLISYPLYLWHWPLLTFVREGGAVMPSAGIRVAVLMLSVALAWATYSLIERPIRFGATSRRTVVMLCGVMAAVGVSGYVTYVQKGQSFRYPAGFRALLEYSYDFKRDIHVGCWLPAAKGFEEFPASCVSTATGRPAVALWGDSHAGRLYPGLKNVMQDRIAISDFARDSCPPLVGAPAAECRAGNASAIRRIQELHPETVLIFANWSVYTAEPDAKTLSTQLMQTIAELQRLGIANIVVLGPAPKWLGSMPTRLSRRVQADGPPYRIPDRLSDGLDPKAASVDAGLESAFDRQQSPRYVSLLRALCNADGCLAHVPGSPADLMTWDYGHLTTPGAEFVVRYLVANKILP